MLNSGAVSSNDFKTTMEKIQQAQKATNTAADSYEEIIEVVIETDGLVKGVQHKLGRKPVGYIVFGRSVAGDVTDPDDCRSQWTDKMIALTFSLAGKYRIGVR